MMHDGQALGYATVKLLEVESTTTALQAPLLLRRFPQFGISCGCDNCPLLSFDKGFLKRIASGFNFGGRTSGLKQELRIVLGDGIERHDWTTLERGDGRNLQVSLLQWTHFDANSLQWLKIHDLIR